MFTDKHNSLIKPPKRLFGVIIERLKIEENLKIFKGKFAVFSVLLAISAILVAAVIYIFGYDLKDSEFVSLVSLLFLNTMTIIKHFKYFALAVLESMSILSITISLAAIVLTMIFLRFVVQYYDQILALSKSIKNKKYV